MNTFLKYILLCFIFFTSLPPTVFSQEVREGDLEIHVSANPNVNVEIGTEVEITIKIISDIIFPNVKISIPLKSTDIIKLDDKGILTPAGGNNSTLQYGSSANNGFFEWKFKIPSIKSYMLANDRTLRFKIEHEVPPGAEYNILELVPTNNIFDLRFIDNEPPIAENDNVLAPNGGKTTDFNVTDNDSDPDGSIDLTSIDLNPATLTVDKSLTIAGKGTFEVLDTPEGFIRFTSDENYTGTFSIPYSIADNLGSRGTAMVNMDMFQTAVAHIIQYDSEHYDADTQTLTVGSCKDETELQATWKGESFRWLKQAGEIKGDNLKEKITVKVPGSYQLLVEDLEKNAELLIIHVRNAPTPTYSAGDDLIISRHTANTEALNVTTSIENPVIKWTPTSGLNLPFALQPIPNPEVDTEYTLELTDKFGCKFTDKVFITVKQEEVGVQIPEENFYGGCFNNATVTATLEGYQSTIKWINSDGVVVGTDLSATINEGTYTVEVTDHFGAKANKTITVSQKELPEIDAGDDITILFDATNTTPFTITLDPALYASSSWSPMTHLTGDRVDRMVPNPTEIGTIAYTLSATDEYNCTVTDEVEVTRLSLPPIAINDTAIVQVNQLGKILVVANDSDPEGRLLIETLEVIEPPMNGTAQPEEGYITYRPSFDFEGLDSLVYEICDDDYQCAQAKLIISVERNVSVFSKVITPNDDGQNDSFFILNADTFENSKLVIYNKAGNVVFTANRYRNNEGWKGEKDDGGIVSTGTYYYNFNFGDGRNVIKGAVYIVTN